MRISQWIFGLFLARFAAEDGRCRRISLRELILFIAVGMAVSGYGFWKNPRTGALERLLFAFLPAVILAVFCRAGRGACGEGDALFFLGAAFYFPGPECLLLFLGAAGFLAFFGLASAAARFGVSCFSGIRKKKLPFLPFVLGTWILMAASGAVGKGGL